MTIFRTALTALALGAAIVTPVSAARAETIRDAVMGFAINFPGDAGPEDLDDELPDWIFRIVAWDQSDDQGYYNVMAVQTLPDSQVYTDPTAVFRDLRSECVVGGKVLSEQPLAISGGLGAEVLTTRTELSGVIFDLVRYVVKKNKIYCVRGTYHDGKDGSRARAFVRSFQVF